MACLRFRQRLLRAMPEIAVAGCSWLLSLLLLAVVFRRCCRKASVSAAEAKPVTVFLQ
jgi:hypothetical protein